ncbi:MAG: hypothetical protein ACXVZX_15520, partial [Terriglobales bacterium]
EIVTIRLRAKIPGVSLGNIASEKSGEKIQAADVWFDGRFRRASIVGRQSLQINRKYRGPAIVTEYSATTVVPPGAMYYLDRSTNLIVKLSPTANVTRRKR